jgi:asparagine synthetase B (glutamine-hydrolysing)
MSGLIVICVREPSADRDLRGTLERCARRLTPDNISPRPPSTTLSPGIGFIVTNPPPGLLLDARGVCLGAVQGPTDAWSRVRSPAPDGSYVLLRHDDGALELISDALGSRTLWYAHTDELFLASTSQRALVSLLGDFSLHREAVIWMATSGTLGPTASWDRRIRRLPGSSTLHLDRRSWRLDLTSEPTAFEPALRSDDDHTAQLGAALLDACSDLRVDLADWVLPLSGGMDSRALLVALLETGRKPRCVTWGLRDAVNDPTNDAAVARELAAATGVEHRYYPTDHSGEEVGRVLGRFLAAGEGRTEDFAGYTDGLVTWKRLYEAGVAGVIRGDEPGWGYRTYPTESYARRRVHLIVLDDYKPSHLIHRLGLEPLPVPMDLRRRDDESLTTYRDRIYEAFNAPTFFAALNDIKTPYVEIANPFLSRRVVDVVRSLPDHLREDRRAFATFVRAYGPDLRYASKAAPAEPTEYLARSDLLAEIRRELGSGQAETVLDRQALDRLGAALEGSSTTDAHRRLRDAARLAVPAGLARRIRPYSAILLSSRELAFRLYIASRMASMLAQDAASRSDVWRSDAATQGGPRCPA